MLPKEMLIRLYTQAAVFVPERAYGGSAKWKNTLQAAQLASSLGIAIQVGRSF